MTTTEIDDFRRIFDASYPKLMAYARRRADASTADDVVAETFLVAWRRRGEVLSMSNHLPWLYGVAGNQLRNQTRSTNRHLRLVAKAGNEPVEDEAAADSAIADGTEVEALRRALSTLSFDDQEVLRLIAWEELTYAEAAGTLGCSIDALAQRIRRAKQRLAAAVTAADTSDVKDPEPTDSLPHSPDTPIAEVQ